MDAGQDASAFLTARVLHDRQPVTYRVLSCALALHVDEAKAALQQFYDARTVPLGAVYVVHGMRSEAPEPNSARIETITLADADALAATRAHLAESTCHIYAVQPPGALDAPLLASVNEALRHDPRYAGTARSALGALRNERTCDGAAPPVRPPPVRPTDVPAHAPAPKMRKVVRQVRTKDEKGYTVTRDVEEYVGGSEDARASEPKPKPEPRAVPKAKATPKQHSLTSFFSKQPRT